MNIKKQIKLDLISIKPYFTLKNLLVFSGIAIFYMFITKSPNILLSISMFFAMAFSAYPFLVGYNSGIDGIYRLFSIDSKDVVLARYILAFIIYVFSSILGITYYLIASKIKAYPINMEILITFGVNFLVFAIIISLQYPIYFKYGYTKAKTWILLPIFILGILGGVVGFLVKDFSDLINFAYQNKELLIILCIIIFILIITISIKLAIKFYRQRDF